MQEFLKKLSVLCGKSVTEEDAFDAVKTLISEKDADIQRLSDQISTDADDKDTKITELNDKIKELTPLAEEGKAYRKGLVDSYVTLKTKLEEIPSDDETKQADARKVAEGFPVDFLKTEIDSLQKRVEEKFPNGSELDNEDLDKDKEEKKGKLVPEENKDSK